MKHNCIHCDHAPFRSAHGLKVHFARMHKHAKEPVTAGSGSSNALVLSDKGPFQCEHCNHAPFDSRIGLGMHRRRAHGISREKHLKMVARGEVVALTVRTRTLRATEQITDFRVIQSPKHQLKFCPGCSFPMRDLLDGAHAEGSPFKLQVCPCCLFPVEAMTAAEKVLDAKHETSSVTC